ncbi:hypothetical protein FIBSPDRAFT_1049881 [Athelia psychrophila]|uniref:DUF6589 domain-containing protein n=1 Tax=Athelia psychrophila TaxID=1759441 RepID=A0A166BJQ4_9AGAM|nr:hypothetical protein FIBSPDRAFT_1049881 [Fibularhizoctonia sp. CBS 109695]
MEVGTFLGFPTCKLRYLSAAVRTPQAKQQQKATKMGEIHPLATSGKNGATIFGMKDGSLDFSAQMGQTPEDYDFRLGVGSGDGMSDDQMLIVTISMMICSSAGEISDAT